MRIVSGIQPSGRLHLGNLLGMVRPAIDLASQNELFCFIADYHALTSLPEPSTLKENTVGLAVDLLACGLDPTRSILFRQSDVPQITELSWLLSTVTPVGLLARSHAYKDKVQRGLAPNHGLYSYPVLMAADILALAAELVPVGQDQRQHLEMARDIGTRFNAHFGQVLTLPRAQVSRGATVPGVDGRKMSKTYGNTIDVFGSEQELESRVMSIRTDSRSVSEPKDPADVAPYALYRLLASPGEAAEMALRLRDGDFGYQELKRTLFEKARSYLQPLWQRRAQLAADPAGVEAILSHGGLQAQSVATRTLATVRTAMGLPSAPVGP